MRCGRVEQMMMMCYVMPPLCFFNCQSDQIVHFVHTFFSFGLFCIYPHFCQSPETVSFKSFHFPGQTPCLPGGHLPPTEKHHLPSPPVWVWIPLYRGRVRLSTVMQSPLKSTVCATHAVRVLLLISAFSCFYAMLTSAAAPPLWMEDSHHQQPMKRTHKSQLLK